jgi:hypothetical protein
MRVFDQLVILSEMAGRRHVFLRRRPYHPSLFQAAQSGGGAMRR